MQLHLTTVPARSQCQHRRRPKSLRRETKACLWHVVAHATPFRNAFRNNACERPPRPRLFRNGSVLLMARPLLRLRPVGLALRALLCKEGNAPAPESMAKIMLDASYNLKRMPACNWRAPNRLP